VYIRQSAHHHFATPNTLRATAVNLPRYRATEPKDVWNSAIHPDVVSWQRVSSPLPSASSRPKQATSPGRWIVTEL